MKRFYNRNRTGRSRKPTSPWVSLGTKTWQRAAEVSKLCGWERFRPEFLNWVYRVVGPDHYRAIGGDGGIFLMREQKGPGTFAEVSRVVKVSPEGAVTFNYYVAGAMTAKTTALLEQYGTGSITLTHEHSASGAVPRLECEQFYLG